MLLAACEQFATIEDFNDFPCDCSDTPEEIIEEALDLASDTLVFETNQRFFGRCTQVVLPCRDACPDVWCWCGCERTGGIEIPGTNPTIEAVAVDGVTLDPVDYEFVRGFPHDRLYRVGASWPHNANRGGPVLAVTVEHGHHVNQWARDAALEVACYLVKRSNNKQPKGLDPRARRATVDGVGMELSEEDKIGMPAVSRFLSLYPAPTSAIWSPELEPAWRV